MPRILSRMSFAGLVGLSFLASAGVASAHHGWAWTAQDEWFELSGTLTDIYIGQPHPTLGIDDGENGWTVELAPVAGTVGAGFREDTAAIGEAVTVIGHRATNEGTLTMKAVRVIVPAGTFDVYPDFAARYDSEQ